METKQTPPPITLKGKNASYEYSTDNKNFVLKAKGKFNSVFLGFRVEDKQTVIIKKLNTNLCSEPNAIERFSKEFKLNVNHQNIIQTIDFIQQEGNYYIVREYVEGIDLQKLLKDSKLKKQATVSFLLKCFMQVLDALDALHSQQIYHCDIRPANILVVKENDKIDFENPKVKLLDLGLAKDAKGLAIKQRTPFSLIYSPPEQVLNFSSLVNVSSDLFSFGITCYELITGKIPFNHQNPEILMNLQISQPLQPDKKLPEALYQILLKATSKYRFKLPPNRYPNDTVREMLREGQVQRFQSALELKAALLEITNTIENKEVNDNGLKRLFRKLTGR